MSAWFSVLKTLFSITDAVAKYMHDKQLLDAGEYKAIAKGNADAVDKINAAISARANASSMRDPNDAANH